MTDPLPIIVYYDGWCSACNRSARMFEKLDRQRGIVRCVDFRSDDPLIYDAGVDPQTLATSLHTRMPDGTLHSGPEAIRQAMNALGRGSSVAWTRWPVIRPIVNGMYRVFARNRMRWFGKHACMEGTCAVNPSSSNKND